MPDTWRDGVRLHWRIDGTDDRPALLLLNSIGTDMTLWASALPSLLTSFRLLRMDTRGHGASDAPGSDYTLAMLAADSLAVMDAAGIDRCAVAGVSLGGMVAMEMALSAPARVAALALVCTSARMDAAAWGERVVAVRAGGTAAIADLAMARFFSKGFKSARPEVVEGVHRELLRMADTGYAGCAAAIRDMELADRLGDIACPALVVTGAEDASTPFARHGDFLLASIAGARHVALPTGHLAPLETPTMLAEALASFLLVAVPTPTS